jgi:hypothetical protein
MLDFLAGIETQGRPVADIELGHNRISDWNCGPADQAVVVKISFLCRNSVQAYQILIRGGSFSVHGWP